jgi:uncharacterized protein
MKALLMMIVKAYRVAGAPVAAALGAQCRFHPSCSAYALGALERHPVPRALWLIAKRLGRCGPWGEGGIDLVPERKL